MCESIIYMLIQGIAEAFPVSSSLHISYFLPAFKSEDAIMHLGTGLAFAYFSYRFIKNIIFNFFKIKIYRKMLFFGVVIVLPTIAAGYFIRNRDVSVYYSAFFNLVFGILMFISDFLAQKKGFASLNFKKSIMLGCIIALALIPGVSRFGITFTCLRFLRWRRKEAFFASLLLGIPITLGAGSIGVLKSESLIFLFLSFIAGILTYALLPVTFKLIHYFRIYALYRICLSIFIVAY